MQMLQSMTKYIFLIIAVLALSCENDDGQGQVNPDLLQLNSVSVGTLTLAADEETTNAPVDKSIIVRFNQALDLSSVENNITLKEQNGDLITLTFNYLDGDKTVTAVPEQHLLHNTGYVVALGKIRSITGEEFPGAIYTFRTTQGQLAITSIHASGTDLQTQQRVKNIPTDFQIQAAFSAPLDEAMQFSHFISLRDGAGELPLNFALDQEQKTLTITPIEAANFISKYTFRISDKFTSQENFAFNGFSKVLYTELDSTYKFPEITDDQLLTLVQEQTFKYFWDFAHPVSGLARERNTSGDVVTTGGSGFGVMAIIAGIERGFITRQEGIDRLETIVTFLTNADRFHGVWPHWMNGNTGDVIPFSTKDNGGDLVETAFMIQGLLSVRAYLNDADAQEAAVKAKITKLWETVEWDWYTQGGQDVLYWHWSPNYEWEMNHQIRGWNEGLIVYVLAASSPTHPIGANVYHNGWARNGEIKNGNEYFNINLPLGYNRGGPLFFAHYSFLGLDPRNLEDRYANYWNQNVNHTLINRAYAIANPKNFVGYSAHSWGLTASDNHEGYSAHSPTNDLGVITPTAAVSSVPYTPEASLTAIRHFYYILGDKLWGDYGFYDAFNFTEEWIADSYLAIDQGPIIVMIENHRSALLWELFMANKEIAVGLEKLGFTSY